MSVGCAGCSERSGRVNVVDQVDVETFMPTFMKAKDDPEQHSSVQICVWIQ